MYPSSYAQEFQFFIRFFFWGIQVNPSQRSQQIQQHLGDFNLMKHLLDEAPTKLLIGVTGLNPPQSPAPGNSAAAAVAARLEPPPEFKKPPQARVQPSAPPPAGAVRGGFVKPQDGKPPYGK